MISWALIFFTFVTYAYGIRYVCYFSNSGQYRGGIGTFKPENIDPMQCTHLVFSYVRIHELDFEPTEWNDDTSEMGEGLYSKVLKLRETNKDLKVLLAVGDLMENPDSFIPATSSDANRLAFSKNLVVYVRNRTFDGVQMEWGNLAAKKNPRYDKNKFLLLLKAIRSAFVADVAKSGKPILLLSITLPAIKKQIDEGYLITELVRESDFISVRTFDFLTAEGRKVGLSSAFLPDPNSGGAERYLNVKWAANYYTSLGIPKNKINIGISTYGRSFFLQKAVDHKIGAVAIDHGNVGPWSATVGIIGHYEICQFIWTGGTVVNVPSQGGRYYFSGDQWISYEDTLSVTQKACFIKSEGFGGITFWTLDFDDFTGNGCREGKFPLISTVLHVMKSTDNSICARINSTDYVESLAKNRTGLSLVPPPASAADKMRVVCYYTSWAYFRRGKGQFVPENINPNLCTHIIYAYAIIEDNRIVPFMSKETSEPWREGLFDRFIKAREINPALKVLIGFGGGAGDKFVSELAPDSQSRKVIASHVVAFLRDKGFDGLEVTWEMPSSDQKPIFMDLMQSLRAAFDADASSSGKPRLILAASMPAGKSKIDIYGNDIVNIEKLTDFLNIRTYDFHGHWDAHTGFNSPLYEDIYESAENRYLNLNWVVRYYIAMGATKSNINLGIATYGRSFTLADVKYNGVYAPAKGAGVAGQYTGIPGLLGFYEVCDFIANGAEVVEVPAQRVPYVFMNDQWVGYDDTSSVIEKACYAKKLGYGGVNVWSLDLDDFMGISCDQGKFPLLSSIFNITQGIDTTKCSNFQLMYSMSSAAEMTLPGQRLLYINLILLSVSGLYMGCN